MSRSREPDSIGSSRQRSLSSTRHGESSSNSCNVIETGRMHSTTRPVRSTLPRCCT